jgi:RNA polymerase sigma factor (TIGR02999 family)
VCKLLGSRQWVGLGLQGGTRKNPAQEPSHVIAISPHTPVAADRPAAASADALFESLYDELRRLARREVWRNGAKDIVGTTTLVHEAWLDISRRPSLGFDGPNQFLAYAGQAMRGLVIDRLRASQAQKRGGGFDIVPLDTHTPEAPSQPQELLQLSEALDELAAVEPELANVVDLKFFCGFTLAEVARMQGVSERTVQRHWEKARMLLYRAIA